MFRLFRYRILLSLIGIGALWLIRIPLAEYLLSQQLRTTVTLEDLQILPHKIILRGFKLRNPPPATLSYALQGSQITLDMGILEFFKKTIQVEKIHIQDLIVTIELYNAAGNNNNWARFLALDETPHPHKAFLVGRLELTNIHFQALRSNGKEIIVPPIPHLELNHFGTHQPLTIYQIEKLLFRTIVAHSSKLPSHSLTNSIAIAPKKKFFEQTKKTVCKSTATLARKAQNTTSFLQNLLSNSLHLNRSNHKIFPS